ncbi:MAG: excinuclease ABC subunit UvrA, partial [Clostridia bacterium]|nr:excinuclease ABC subunit UvrA [Clostridia bacterium]
MKEIFIKGAKENNLQNVDLTIPRDKLVVFSGLSGSGKSSLAFDTIFAEGQRKYMESLSSYARMFLGQMQKPDVDYIEGLSPAVSIDQKTTSKNPRSTVGTVTEIYDYLRLMFARIGKPHCPKCGREIDRQTVDQITDKIMARTGAKTLIIAPVVRGRKGEYKKELEQYKRAGYVRVRIDGVNYTLDEDINLDKNIKHEIGVIIDRLVIKEGAERRVSEAIENAVKLAEGLILADFDGDEVVYSTKYACPHCELSFEELTPRLFSFNNPYGACPNCTGLGFTQKIDPKLLIRDENMTLREGGIKASGWYIDTSKITRNEFKALADAYNFSLDVPIKDLPESALNVIFYGTEGAPIEVEWNSRSFSGMMRTTFEGIVNNLERRYRETDSEMVKAEISHYMINVPCPVCHGKRLKPEALAVIVGGLNIYDMCEMSVAKMSEFITGLQLTETEEMIARRIVKEIQARLNFLINVGLGYLTLSRTASTLSG